MLITLNQNNSIADLVSEISSAANGGKPGVIFMKHDDYSVQISTAYAEIAQTPGNGPIIKILAERV